MGSMTARRLDLLPLAALVEGAFDRRALASTEVLEDHALGGGSNVWNLPWRAGGHQLVQRLLQREDRLRRALVGDPPVRRRVNQRQVVELTRDLHVDVAKDIARDPSHRPIPSSQE
jgi:hypothetical protein